MTKHSPTENKGKASTDQSENLNYIFSLWLLSHDH